MNRGRILTIATALLAVMLVGCNPQLADEGDAKPSGAAGSSASAAMPSGAGGGGPAEGGLSLVDAIAKIPAGAEKRDGYERNSFRHWTDEDDDNCETRAEVLLEEATMKLEQGERCALTGGVWLSYYDAAEVTEARKLDIDHMVSAPATTILGISAGSAVTDMPVTAQRANSLIDHSEEGKQ